MPLPAAAAAAATTPSWIGPAIGAVGGIVGSLFKGKQDRDFSREQFEAQNREFDRRFNMTNEYNSPRNQAARLEQAGLNKALMYGQGAAGASGNTQLQGQSNAQAVNHVDPLSTGLSYLSAFQDLRVKQAQADNIAADTSMKASREFLNIALTKDRNIFRDNELRNLYLKGDLTKSQTKAADQQAYELYNRVNMLYGPQAGLYGQQKRLTYLQGLTEKDRKRLIQLQGTHQSQINKLYDFGGVTRDPMMAKLLGVIMGKIFK